MSLYSCISALPCFAQLLIFADCCKFTAWDICWFLSDVVSVTTSNNFRLPFIKWCHLFTSALELPFLHLYTMLKIKKNRGLMGCRLSLGMGTKGLSMFTISKKVPKIQNCPQTFAYDSPKQGMKWKMPLQKAFHPLFQCFVNLCYGNPFNSSYPILFHLIFWHGLFKNFAEYR